MSTSKNTAPVNREDWLTQLGQNLHDLVSERTGLTPKPYRVSCGFPSVRARSATGRIGECHYRNGKGPQEIFIHPRLDDAVEVASTLLHEILHASLPTDVGHKKPFAKAAEACGLDGKPTATFASDDLKVALKEITDKLGTYPHESLTAVGKKQKTNLLKAGCQYCGYIVRVTMTHIDESGHVICPNCDVPFEFMGTKDKAADPLVAVDQSVEYKVRPSKPDPKKPTIYDPRWSLRMNKQGRKVEWFVIDYGTATLGLELSRLTPAESRDEALTLLNALREGLMTYDDLVTDETEAWEDDESDEWDEREAGKWDAPNDSLADDEDETPDYEDGEVDPDDEDAYVEQVHEREVAPKRATPTRQEREPGSWQYRMRV